MIGPVVALIAIFTVSSLFFSDTDDVNLDVSQVHGSVVTAMGSPILGSSDAQVTIIEFGDYQCPNCKKWFLETKPEIISNLIDDGKANLVFVDIAFLGKDSLPASMASYCAEEQGKYWEYHTLLYSNQQGIDTGWASAERLYAFAFSLGLDMDLFGTCLDSGKYAKRVHFNTNEAKKNGVTGTPTFIIVGIDGSEKRIVGPQPYSVFENTINSM